MAPQLLHIEYLHSDLINRGSIVDNIFSQGLWTPDRSRKCKFTTVYRLQLELGG